MRPDRERSRAYPVMDLEAACEILSRKLRHLESENLDRESLAKQLGYETGGGGVAARKIGALVHYGFLDRRSGRYSLSRRGIELQKIRRESPKFRSVIQSALEQPALFRWILSRYRRVGRVPESLAGVLIREYGITERASDEAAKVFLRSARFAGVLDLQGSFFEGKENLAWANGSESIESPDDRGFREAPETRVPPLELSLTNRRKAWLTFPDVVTDDDIEMLEQRLRFELETGGLRKYVRIDAKSSTGNVIPVGFGQRSGKPKK